MIHWELQLFKRLSERLESNDLITKAEQKDSLFLSLLVSIVDDEIVISIRGRGMMFAVDLVNKKVTDEIYNELINLGYIVGNRGSTFRIDPPLILAEAEFKEFIDTIKAVISSKKRRT